MDKVNRLEDFLCTMTAGEFKAFRKALNVLLRSGLSRGVAIDLLADAYMVRKGNRFNQPVAEVATKSKW